MTKTTPSHDKCAGVFTAQEALAHEANLVLDLSLLPARCGCAGNRLDQVVAAHLKETAMVLALPAMIREALSSGEVGPPSRKVQRLQIVTVDRLFNPHPVSFPGVIDLPELGRAELAQPVKKRRNKIEGQTELLLPILGAPSLPEAEGIRAKRAIRSANLEVIRAQNEKKVRR